MCVYEPSYGNILLAGNSFTVSELKPAIRAMGTLIGEESWIFNVLLRNARLLRYYD
jgi:hypothetical protein